MTDQGPSNTTAEGSGEESLGILIGLAMLPLFLGTLAPNTFPIIGCMKAILTDATCSNSSQAGSKQIGIAVSVLVGIVAVIWKSKHHEPGTARKAVAATFSALALSIFALIGTAWSGGRFSEKLLGDSLSLWAVFMLVFSVPLLFWHGRTDRHVQLLFFYERFVWTVLIGAFIGFAIQGIADLVWHKFDFANSAAARFLVPPVATVALGGLYAALLCYTFEKKPAADSKARLWRVVFTALLLVAVIITGFVTYEFIGDHGIIPWLNGAGAMMKIEAFLMFSGLLLPGVFVAPIIWTKVQDNERAQVHLLVVGATILCAVTAIWIGLKIQRFGPIENMAPIEDIMDLFAFVAAHAFATASVATMSMIVATVIAWLDRRSATAAKP